MPEAEAIARRNLEVLTAGQTYEVGRCIYCGTTEGPLTLEHVIPYALGGRLCLGHASCANCQRAILSFETKILRGQLLDYRDAVGYPSRRPRQRRAAIPARVGGELRAIEPGHFPRILMLKTFEQPGILIGRNINQAVMQTVFTSIPREDRASLGPEQIQQITTTFDDFSFCRLLAKIGWGAAVAHYGLNRLWGQGLLALPVILHGDPKAHHLIGNPIGPFKPMRRHLHELAVDVIELPSGKFLVASVRLFAYAGAPPYQVVLAKQ